MVAYLDAVGLRTMMEKQREQSAQAMRQQLSDLLEQTRSQFPHIPASVFDELEGITQGMTEELSNAYTVDEVLRIYAEPFDRNYPGPALDEAIAELSSPEGQRLMLTLNEAVTAVYEFRAARQKAVFEQVSRRYVQALQELVARARAETP